MPCPEHPARPSSYPCLELEKRWLFQVLEIREDTLEEEAKRSQSPSALLYVGFLFLAKWRWSCCVTSQQPVSALLWGPSCPLTLTPAVTSLSWDFPSWLPCGVQAWGSPCFAEGGLKLSSVPFEVLEFGV